MLSEEVYLGQFGKDGLAAMSQEQLEQALAWAKQRVVEFEEAENRLVFIPNMNFSGASISWLLNLTER